MHAACLEAEVPGSVSKSEPVQGATVTCVTPGTRSDSGRFAHLHAQRLLTPCIGRQLTMNTSRNPENPSPEQRPRLGCAGIIKRGVAVLLGKRAKDPNRGLWVLPGG